MARYLTNGSDPVDTVVEPTAPGSVFMRAIRSVADRLSTSADHFNIPAQDEKGHTEQINTRVQPGWARTIQTIVESRRFPFRSGSDFVRWAIHAGMYVLLELDPEVNSVDRQAEVIIRIVRSRDQIKRMKETMDVAAEQVGVMLREGLDSEVAIMVAEVKQAIAVMPPGQAKTKYEARFAAEFAVHLKPDDIQIDLFSFEVDDDND